MFCRKCGKEIDYEASFCKECEEKFLSMKEETPIFSIAETNNSKTEEVFFSSPKVELKKEEQPDRGSRSDGLKKAITSAILGECAILLAVLLGMYSIIFLEFGMMSMMSIYNWKGIILCLFAIGLLAMNIPAYLSLRYGIQAIKCFIRAVKEQRAKPVATLVCGIYGVVCSVITLMYTLIMVSIYMLMVLVLLMNGLLA